MRRGLIFVGVAVALIGVGVLIAAFGASPGPSTADVQRFNAPVILPNSTYQHVVASVLQKSASVVYAWSATRSVKVGLYVAGGCANNTPGYVCPAGPPLMSWWTTSGVYSYSAAVIAPWLVVVQNPNGTNVGFNATLVETYVVPPAFGGGAWNVYVLIAGSIVLIGIGALALFLGLFLRGGVYGPPPVPRGQPDASLLRPAPDDLDDGWDGAPAIDEPDDEET